MANKLTVSPRCPQQSVRQAPLALPGNQVNRHKPLTNSLIFITLMLLIASVTKLTWVL